ncbi:hypothetical protein N183_27095 [Sinorhizobium sp. Sb3]|uniref:hypothetical protein n=1 Tax=Sinorhizobium sp. Sb3 TaxID=1358417 RepID=UPI00071DC5D6|nr:hypothetical protein [Sinorhizobium sp. Sb3]KSV72238.1 hypothetical protein N183_27095 [Sinorhizobium sp. Sb3]
MGKQPTKGHDDDYFSKQWAELLEREKADAEEFRRKWLIWQKRNEGRLHYTPWLIIPAHQTDCGLRPLPSGTPYWASPFIGVNSPDPSGKPLAGAENQVVARVFNLGALTSAPTIVRFYWADPSVGLGAANAHQIGSIMIEVPPLSSQVIACPTPWIPTFLNNGHECLFVSADNAVLDPVTAPFEPWSDRHFGQRNVSVLPAVQQLFQLWLPASAARVIELRALALKVTVPQGLSLRRTPAETIDQVAQMMLAGLGGGRPVKERGGRQKISYRVERIAAERVIDGAKLLGETQPSRARINRGEAELQQAGHALGEVVLQAAAEPDLAQLCQISLRGTDLAVNEFILLSLSGLAGQIVEGGYLLTLANPKWFEPDQFVLAAARGSEMSKQEKKRPSGDLRDLVIAHNPQANATYEIVSKLAGQLPIRSAKELGRGVPLGDQVIPQELIAQLGDGLFPIESEEDLVIKVSAMLRTFASEGEAHRPILSSGAARLLDTLHAFGGKPPIQALIGRGKPIFPVKPEGEEK